jgi:hypothetical protein
MSYFSLVSHLCDTLKCLRLEHIIDEPVDVNLSRQKCAGMVIGIRDNSITDMAPCRHGVEACDLNGDSYEFSCRKLRAIFHFPRACAYMDSLRS